MGKSGLIEKKEPYFGNNGSYTHFLLHKRIWEVASSPASATIRKSFHSERLFSFLFFAGSGTRTGQVWRSVGGKKCVIIKGVAHKMAYREAIPE